MHGIAIRAFAFGAGFHVLRLNMIDTAKIPLRE